MDGTSKQFFEFDAFRVDVKERRLIKNGETIALTPKVFDILLALVENSGRTIEKNELMQTVWEDTFVEEGNLNRHISTLRKLLGDDPHEQRFIKTIPKRGYRFTGDVKEIVGSRDLIGFESISRSHMVIREETRESFWTTSRGIIAAGVLIGVSLLGAWAWSSANANNEPKRARMTANTEAAEAYTMGRRLWSSRSAGSLHQATLLLEKAVQADPGFALGHAALADAYAFDYTNWKKAEDQANIAISLDPSLGEPHASIGFVRLFWEWDLDGAESELKQAVTLSPDYATAHQWYAAKLAAGAQVDAAIVEIGKAQELDPASVSILSDKCQFLYFAAMYKDALVECQKALQIDPGSISTSEHIYDIYSALGLNDEAVDKFIENRKLYRGEFSPSIETRLRRAYAEDGSAGFRSAQLVVFAGEQPNHFRLAQTYARLGDHDKALESLQRSYELREFDLIFVDADPVFAALQFDKRLKLITDRFHPNKRTK